MKKRWIGMMMLVAFVAVSQANTVTWDNGGSDQYFYTAANWIGDANPVSGVDSVVLDADAVGLNKPAILTGTDSFVIGNGLSMTSIVESNLSFRVELKLESSSVLTLSTGGELAIGVMQVRGPANELVFESGASADFYNFLIGDGTVVKFVADATSVTTVNVRNNLDISKYGDSGNLEVDLSNYDAANGHTLVLFDYNSLVGDQVFASVTLTEDWTADIDHAYDQGGGDLAVALVNIQYGAIADATSFSPAGGIAIELRESAAQVMGSVDVAYAAATDVDISFAVSQETHSGSFSVVNTSPQTLATVFSDMLTVDVEFDNTIAGLWLGQTATGMVTLTWSEQGSGITTDVLIPVSASALDLPVVWDNGGADILFANPENWEGGIAPVSGNDDVAMNGDAGGANQGDAFLKSEFMIGAGKSMTSIATPKDSEDLKLSSNGAFTLATGGTLDIGLLGRANSGSVNMSIVFEAGASANVYEYVAGLNTTTKFVANSAGVTALNISDELTLDKYGRGDLEVDLASYSIANGSILILMDYGSIATAGTNTFATVTLTAGWSATVDYAYDQGGGDLAVALILPGGEPSAYEIWTRGYGLTGDDALPKTDVESDGLDNLMEYALGGNPLNDDASVVSPATFMADDGVTDYFYYVYDQRTDDSGLTFTLGTETDLTGTTSWDTNDVFQVGESVEAGGFKTVTNRTAVSSGAKFIELRVGK